MKQYLELGNRILNNGNIRPDRTGTGTLSVFGHQMRFDLQEGFPLLTTKKMFLKGIIHELLWFLQGDTNNNTLNANGVTIWDEWCLKNGDLGPVYGKQWRSWLGNVEYFLFDNPEFPINAQTVGVDEMGEWVQTKHDQISELIHNLKNNPYSRRHVISAWNVADLPDETISPQENVKNGKMALAPCHCLFQFYVREMTNNERLDIVVKRDSNDLQLDLRGHYGEKLKERLDKRGIPKFKLDCQLYQRSGDVPLGIPYNIASYALLTMMIAQCVNMVPGEFVHTLGDAHVYANQIEKFKEQMLRTPRALPIMKINPEVKDIFAFKFEDFELTGYDPHPRIDYEISI